MEEDGFAEKLDFSDEATFHVCGRVNRHSLRILGTEHSHASVKHVHYSPEVAVFCAVSPLKVHGSFFFVEPICRYQLPGRTTTVANATITGIQLRLHSPTRRSPARLPFRTPWPPLC